MDCSIFFRKEIKSQRHKILIMVKYFWQLLKFKLSITVVFSAMIGYLLGFDQFNLQHFSCLIFGGFLVTGSANAFNQILEKEKDTLMDRTSIRPLPQGNLTVVQALIFAFIIGKKEKSNHYNIFYD